MVARATILQSRRVRETGFTVIEMISVIVVLAVLSAVSIPSLTSMQGSRGAAAARHLLRDLTYAREHAMATGTGTWVVLDTVTHKWDVLSEDPGSPGRSGASLMTDPATGGPYTIQLDAGDFNGIQITTADFNSGDEIGFDWLGQPLNDGESGLTAQGSVDLTGGHTVTVATGNGRMQYVAP